MTDLELPGITESGRSRRGVKPAVHWADLSVADRVAAATEAGLPRFRADQISRRYYGHNDAATGTWTEFSSALAEQVAHPGSPNCWSR